MLRRNAPVGLCEPTFHPQIPLSSAHGSQTHLQNGARSDFPDLFGFESWADVVSQARAEDDGPLLAFVDLVEDYGIDRLLQAFRRTVDHEASASLVISTAHRSKGREWEKVELTDDYVIERIVVNGVQHPMPEEELRIAYVAMTRATGEVQLPEGIVRRFNIAVPRERERAYSGTGTCVESSLQAADERPVRKRKNAEPVAASGKGILGKIREMFN